MAGGRSPLLVPYMNRRQAHNRQIDETNALQGDGVDNKKRRYVVWRFTDGKPGHENQTLGLLEALAELVAIDVFDIPAPSNAAAVGGMLFRKPMPYDDLAAPDFIVCAGHATHLPGLAARKRHGGKIIVLMKPSLPINWFDLCIIPAHDNPPLIGKVIRSRGVLNRVRPSLAKIPGTGLILIGGPAKHTRWDEPRVLDQIRSVVAASNTSWLVANSRRTPESTTRAIARLNLSGTRLVDWRTTDGRWLSSQLDRAAIVWITRDSVSMVYEAITSGAACGLLQLPIAKPGRVNQGIDKLVGEGFLVTFDAWRAGRPLHPPGKVLNEAARCARLIQTRWMNDHAIKRNSRPTGEDAT